MSSMQVLQFKSEQDKDQYLHYWKVNSGLFTGKSCQLSRSVSTPSTEFKTLGTFVSNPNHKGKS